MRRNSTVFVANRRGGAVELRSTPFFVLSTAPEAIDQRLRDVASLYELGMLLPTARRLGTVAEVRERDRLEAEARDGEFAATIETPHNES